MTNEKHDILRKFTELPVEKKVIGAIVLAAVCVFLPWIGVGYSANIAGFSGGASASVSGLSVNGGIVGLLSSMVGIYLFRKKDKWAVIPGIVNLFAGLGYVFNFFGPMASGSFNYSSNLGNASASIEIKFGLILFLVFSAYYPFVTGREFLENHNK